MYKRLLVSHKLLWSVSVHVAGVVPHLVAIAWAQRGHSECFSVTYSFSTGFLTSTFLETEPEHGAVLVLVVIIPNMRDLVHLLQCAGEDQEGVCEQEVQAATSWSKVGRCGEPGVER